jgi:hypothetical protein
LCWVLAGCFAADASGGRTVTHPACGSTRGGRPGDGTWWAACCSTSKAPAMTSELVSLQFLTRPPLLFFTSGQNTRWAKAKEGCWGKSLFAFPHSGGQDLDDGPPRATNPGPQEVGTVGTSAAVPSPILPGRASQGLEITTITAPSEIQRMSRPTVISSLATRSSSSNLGDGSGSIRHAPTCGLLSCFRVVTGLSVLPFVLVSVDPTQHVCSWASRRRRMIQWFC